MPASCVIVRFVRCRVWLSSTGSRGARGDRQVAVHSDERTRRGASTPARWTWTILLRCRVDFRTMSPASVSRSLRQSIDVVRRQLGCSEPEALRTDVAMLTAGGQEIYR